MMAGGTVMTFKAKHEEDAIATPSEIITETDEKGHLRVARRIGLIGGIAFITRSVIGPVVMSLIIWTLCGVCSLLLALVYAELAVILPRSGGDYTYIRTGIRNLPAFLITWVQTTISQAGSRTVLALVFADYLCAPCFGQCGPPASIRKTLEAVDLLTLAICKAFSVQFEAAMQILVSSLKELALIIISTGGLVYLIGGKVDNLYGTFHGTTSGVTYVSLAIYSCIRAFSGFTAINEIAEELIEPKKTIPRAIIISMILITAIYITTHLPYFVILPKAEVLSVPAVAFTWGDHVLGSAAILIPISVMCSVHGASNGGFFTDVRVRFAAARADHLLEVMSFVHHKSGIPLASLVFNVFISIVLLVPGDVNELINLVGFMSFLNNSLSIFALLRFKYQRRHSNKDEGQFRLPLIVPILALIKVTSEKWFKRNLSIFSCFLVCSWCRLLNPFATKGYYFQTRANSVDTDQTESNSPSDQCPHCLLSISIS